MKTFLITGASSGIGAATARRARNAGYRVVLAARSKSKLEELAKELGGPEYAIAVACDVTQDGDQEKLISTAVETFGSIDVVFANAGFGATGSGTAGGDPENWKDMILTNIYGCIMTCRTALDEIKKSKGHFILTSSVAGRVTLKGSVYGATKWAVTGYGRNLREEVKDDGVRVTLIEPGKVDTPFFDDGATEALHAEDIAQAVMYAVSQPEHVNVSEILVMPNYAKQDD
ncbi:SDR family oxidoreductase [Ahrensia kielensis]|uniref:SDR family oxidoreductase n=1 Tax=Ahrensia kielensis TaxID=76980 RepID=UPI0003766051|nr:SDR family oxidoreductase [Ahrensia kielensis]